MQYKLTPNQQAGYKMAESNFLIEDYEIPKNELEYDIYLKRSLEDITKMLNRKDTGVYDLIEQQVNQQYFGNTQQTKRQVFRKAVSTGALPNAVIKTVAHGISGINSTWQFTRIYGFAQNQAVPRWIPIPNGTATYPISLWVDATNISLETTVNLTAFINSYVILEYFKA